MYSGDKWTHDTINHQFTYTLSNEAELTIKFSPTRNVGELVFDNWWVDKKALDELIAVLQQVKLYMP